MLSPKSQTLNLNARPKNLQEGVGGTCVKCPGHASRPGAPTITGRSDECVTRDPLEGS